MSIFNPGMGGGAVAAAATSVTGITVLPRTGMDLSVDLALAAVLGLVAWAGAYGISAKARG